ncbi:MAG TPA: glycosyltransferase family 4 protein [Clostridia bacterium]|jgi:glycosyltransferase involved in cell wall biosynthesis|nr:glycosyltransferase family 4 protein [Clostridia bacterium]
MKILQVVTLSEVGGAQKVLFNIVSGLHNKADFEFHVAAAPGGELVDWLRGIGVRVFEIPELVRPISPANDLKALIKLKKLMQEEKYDLVHCHSSKAGMVGRFAAKWAGVPRIVFTVHGWGVNDRQPLLLRTLLGTAEKLAGWISTDVVCVSQADYRLGKKFVKEEKRQVIYNGVEEPKGRRGKLREELGIGKDDIVITMAARLKKPKEPLLFLQVAAIMLCNNAGSRKNGKIHFILVGDGPLKKKCMDFVRERKLEKQVHLLGTREDLMELYPDFDIFVLLSSWEGLPLTICEAMREGLPVVASRVGGIEEQVQHGWNGFLLDKNAPDLVKDYIEKLVRDELLRQKMGANSKRKGEELFRIERMVGEYERLYSCDLK